MVYNVLRKVVAVAAVETSVHTGREKAVCERLIFRVRNIWFPQTHSAGVKVIFTSIPALATRVGNKRNVSRYNMDETPGKKRKKVKKVIEKVPSTVLSRSSSTKTKMVPQKAQPKKEKTAIYKPNTGRYKGTCITRPTPVTMREFIRRSWLMSNDGFKTKFSLLSCARQDVSCHPMRIICGSVAIPYLSYTPRQRVT